MFILPRATEKAYNALTENTYIFLVPKDANKVAIKETVAREFGVTVLDVRTTIRNGKKTRFSRGRHAYPGTAYRQDKKYAYVTLKAGDKIRVFDEQPEHTTKQTKAPSTTKADAQPAKSDTTKQQPKTTARRAGNRGGDK